jgi:hypothetical protein
MSDSRRKTDQEIWNAFIKDVTPLGQPEPANSSQAVERIIHSPRASQLDLHGLTLVEAHTATMNLVAATDRSVTVVTGISGVIKKEFPHWFDHLPHIKIEEMNGGGAFRLFFRKRKR